MHAVSLRLQLEAPHPLGAAGIGETDDVVAPARAQRVDVVTVHEEIVDPAGQLIRELRQHRHALAGIAGAEHHDAVAAVRRALAADHGQLAVGGDLHVVHGPGVDLHLVDLLDVGRVAHVPEVGMPVGAPRAGDGVVPAVGSLPDPEVRRAAVEHPAAADDLHVARHVARLDGDRPRGRVGARRGDHRVGAGALGDEAAVRRDLGRGAGRDDGRRGLAADRVAHRHAGHLAPSCIGGDRREAQHVAGAGTLGARLQFQRHDRILDDFHGQSVALGVDRGRHGGRTRCAQGQETEPIDGRHGSVAAGECNRHVVPARPGGVGHDDVETRLRPGVEGAGDLGEGNLRDGRQRHRHGHLDPRTGVRTPAPVAGIHRHQNDQRVLAGTIGFDATRAGHAHAAPRARVVDDGRIVHNVAGAVPHGSGQLGRLANLERQRAGLDLDGEPARRLVPLAPRRQGDARRHEPHAGRGARDAHRPSHGPPLRAPARHPRSVPYLAAHLAPLPCLWNPAAAVQTDSSSGRRPCRPLHCSVPSLRWAATGNIAEFSMRPAARSAETPRRSACRRKYKAP